MVAATLTPARLRDDLMPKKRVERTDPSRQAKPHASETRFQTMTIDLIRSQMEEARHHLTQIEAMLDSCDKRGVPSVYVDGAMKLEGAAKELSRFSTNLFMASNEAIGKLGFAPKSTETR